MARYILFILTVLAAPCARAQHWHQQVNYDIDVTLTDSSHSLDGTETIHYINHSPDTLSFIWIRCWANAYKSDRTAFSEQLIRNGRTDFYFSDKSQKGYINRLEFRVDGQLARMEDHPQYIDLTKVIFPHPLRPGDSAVLTTPFHVQLPDNFSHFGYHRDSYALTQWYPRASVYDSSGWHPDPCLDQGGVYNEYGDFKVHINTFGGFRGITSSPSDVPDFVWFTSRRYQHSHDTLLLPSGRTIDLFVYYFKPTSPIAKYSIQLLKDALRFHSTLLGDYPFNAAAVVETRSVPDNAPDAAAYPGVISVDSRDSLYWSLERSIEKCSSDQWFRISVGVNGRRYPWMTEGISEYYYNRYRSEYRPVIRKFPIIDTYSRGAVNTQAVLQNDQPVFTSSADFTAANFQLIARKKTAIWLLELEHALGRPRFDSSMRLYLTRQWHRQTGPNDLKNAFAACNQGNPHLNLDSAFALLDTTGPVPPSPFHRSLQPAWQLLPTHRNTLNIFPAIGFNDYDHLMIGAVIHNFNLPPDHWQILAAPLYSPASHQLNGLAHLNYAWYPQMTFRLVEAGINGSRFSTISGTDSNSHAIFGGFYKVVPYLRFFFPQSVGSTRETSLEWKTFLIGEKGFNNYVLKSTDSLYYPVVGKYDFRYLNQLSFTVRERRTLYPYSIELQTQQAAQFYRVNLDIRYFFNYPAGGGLDVRFFGAKFGYLGDPAEDLTQYEPKLTAVRGDEDYTYGNYFIGRNEFNGIASQQIMMRDGDLKLRTDLFQGLQGRSDDWVAAVNLNSTLPPQIVPAWIPLRLFLDVGTYAAAWQNAPPTSHFLYTAGFEGCFFHDVLRIYAPILYSSDFSSQLKTVPGQNGFMQKLSFSIDFQNLPIRQIFGYTPF